MRLFPNVDSIHWPVISEFGIVQDRQGQRAFSSPLALPLECLFFKLNIYANWKFRCWANPLLKGLVMNFSLRNLQSIFKKKKGRKCFCMNRERSMPPQPSSGDAHPGRHLEQKYFKRQKMCLREKMVCNSVAHNPCRIIRFASSWCS